MVAETQTETGNNYGRLLRWKDSKGRMHSYSMPVELLHGESYEFIKRLTSEGLELMPTKKHRERLAFYIATFKSNKTIICTDRIGWHDAAFVLPNKSFGSDKDEIIYQSSSEGFHKFDTKGSLQEWQENISKYCVGNSRLAFAASVAFASPLLPVVDLTGGGFHFRGITSTGKTTVLLVAGSIYGGSDTDPHGFCDTWKATANGLEAIAESHNHALLCLDEISECDGRQVGEIAYMLANGRGKNRMAKNISARRPLNWNLLFLSSGEQRLADKMREAGQRVKGGQEIRLCDLEADTSKFGLFENLHGFDNGQEFSDYLRRASKQFYGTAISAFLDWLVKVDRESIRKNWRGFQQKFISELLPENQKYPSEVYRVASRFALVALAGELATESGVTGWTPGTAQSAAKVMFDNWFANREGAGGSDAENAIRQVRLFLESHEQSRFQVLGEGENQHEKVINRVGFKRKNPVNKETEFLVFPESFRSEICKDLDVKFVASVLAERGFLQRDSAGKFQKLERCGEPKAKRLYVITSNIFEGEDDERRNV
ncbi:MAG: DUF927 domain-containing protein [Acidobacteria bacterium]|nr:DUF927 domain-containing protein [Acidobacteriota bacterium]